MTTNKIAVIGGGNLGKSIINGLILSKTINKKNLTVTDIHISSLELFKKSGVAVHSDNKKAVKNSEIIIIAVKPNDIKNILKEIKPLLNSKKHILASTAAGVSIDDIQQIIGKNITCFRVMPNTAMSVQQSMTCLASTNASDEEKKLMLTIFKELGEAIFIEEKLMGAATILGASGIAFALNYIKAAMQAGVEMGFEHDISLMIVEQTVKGATELLEKNKNHPAKEIDKVTTPGGVTITGLNEMENKGFSASVVQGIMKAYTKTLKLTK